MKLAVFTAIVAASSFTLAPSVLAEAYQTEINASYNESESDLYPSDNYSISLMGTRYFSPVDTTRGPLAEAAFLQKVSSFSLLLANNDYESYSQNSDSYFRGARVTYFIPDSLFFIGAAIAENKMVGTYYYHGDYSYQENIPTDWDTQVHATLGIAPIDGLQVWSTFSDDVSVSDYWNLNAKYVQLLAGERAVSVETHYIDNAALDVRSLTVDVDYYFTRQLSLGLGVAHLIFGESDADDDYSSRIRARQFITENASVELTYFSEDRLNGWQLGTTVRF